MKSTYFIRKKKTKVRRGFTLVEMLVSIFIFSILMVTLGGIFANSVAAYKYARQTQRSVEEAQFAMNKIAKTLRTSTIKSVPAAKSVTVYSYSEGKCLRYEITSAGTVTERAIDPGASFDPVLSPCPSFAGVTPRVIAHNLVFAESRFLIIPSSPGNAGRVGMIFAVKRGTEKTVRVQTSVSLRDYEVSGLL